MFLRHPSSKSLLHRHPSGASEMGRGTFPPGVLRGQEEGRRGSPDVPPAHTSWKLSQRSCGYLPAWSRQCSQKGSRQKVTRGRTGPTQVAIHSCVLHHVYLSLRRALGMAWLGAGVKARGPCSDWCPMAGHPYTSWPWHQGPAVSPPPRHLSESLC